MNSRLDPDVRAHQEMRGASRPASLEEMGYEQIRSWMESLPHPAGLPRMQDTETRWIPGPLGDIRLDIHRPTAGPRAPGVLYFHGGGMVMGSNHSFLPTALHIAESSGATVVAVDYHLAPEHPVPAQVDDCFAATAWVAKHAEDLRVDPERLAVVGDSAGGTLAAAVALMARDRGGPSLMAQVLFYPGTDADMAAASMREFVDGPGLTRENVRYLRGLAGESRQADSPYVVPMLAEELSGLPQAVVAVAECDPIRDWGERYAHRLIDARVQTTLTRYPGMVHGFAMQVDQVARARLAMTEVGALLAAKFRHPLPR